LAKGKKPSGTPNPKPAGAGAPAPAKATTPKGPKESAEGKEKTIKVKTRGPFVVGAREEEMEMVQRETHSCGGGFEIEIEEVRPPTETAGPLDVLKTLCTECGAHVDFLFDISSFYDDGDSEFEVAPASGGDEPPEGEDDEGGWLS
jgi:hypothetical protein